MWCAGAGTSPHFQLLCQTPRTVPPGIRKPQPLPYAWLTGSQNSQQRELPVLPGKSRRAALSRFHQIRRHRAEPDRRRLRLHPGPLVEPTTEQHTIA